MSRQRRNVALLGRQKIHSFDTPFSITNLQEFSYPCYPQRPQPFRCFAPCSARFQSRGLRRRLDVEGTRAQTRFSRNMNTSIQNRPLVAGQPNIAFSSLPLRKKRLLFASPARFRARAENQPAKIPNISRPSPRYIYRREIFAIFRVLVDRQNDRFSTLVLPNGTPVAKIGEAKANQQLTRKFLVNFSCNFIRLHVTISLWSKSDQSGAQWKKTAILSQSGRLTASLP